MKHYIYLDNEILNSYISQIYDGILKGETLEKQNGSSISQEVSKPGDKITSTIDGGFPGIIKGKLQGEHSFDSNTNNISDSQTVTEVIEKIYHDNLLDNLITHISENEKVVTSIDEIEMNAYINLKIPFNFTNNDYLKSISNKSFKDSYIKIVNSTNSNNDKEKKEATTGMELIGNFATLFESSFPTKYLIITDTLIIPLNDQYFRESPNIIDFKYGGEVSIVGKITKDCKNNNNIFGLYNEEFAKSLDVVKDTLYKLYLPKYDDSYIVTPIALYFD